eukprot:1352805-Pyramimonas_sp.AAC.1
MRHREECRGKLWKPTGDKKEQPLDVSDAIWHPALTPWKILRPSVLVARRELLVGVDQWPPRLLVL